VLASAIACCALASLGVLGGWSALADDAGKAAALRVAAIGDAPAEPLARPSARIILPIDETRDLRLLLAQAVPAVAADDTILVAFVITAPENAEEELAREHGLELVDSTKLPALDMRIARYRIRNDRLVTSVLAALRADLRVRRVQANYQHRPLPPTGPAIEISAAKDHPVAAKTPDRVGGPLPPPPDRKTVAVGKAVQKPAAPAKVTAAAAAVKTARVFKDVRGNGSAQPLPVSPAVAPAVSKVADVLAGGL
jgi:hypothetical protein